MKSLSYSGNDKESNPTLSNLSRDVMSGKIQTTYEKQMEELAMQFLLLFPFRLADFQIIGPWG